MSCMLSCSCAVMCAAAARTVASPSSSLGNGRRLKPRASAPAESGASFRRIWPPFSRAFPVELSCAARRYDIWPAQRRKFLMCGGDSRFPKRPDYHAREHSQSCGCARCRAMPCLDSTACNVHDGASRRHAHIVHTAAQAHSTARVTAHDRTCRLLAVHCAACAPCVVSCCSSQASMTSCRRSTIIPGIIAQVQNSPGFLPANARGSISVNSIFDFGAPPQGDLYLNLKWNLTRSSGTDTSLWFTPL